MLSDGTLYSPRETENSLTTTQATFPALEADTLTNYGIGVKGSIADRRIQYELATYIIDWEDVQQTINVQIAPTVSATAAVNGESASGLGADAALLLDVTDTFTISLKASS